MGCSACDVMAWDAGMALAGGNAFVGCCAGMGEAPGMPGIPPIDPSTLVGPCVPGMPLPPGVECRNGTLTLAPGGPLPGGGASTAPSSPKPLIAGLPWLTPAVAVAAVAGLAFGAVFAGRRAA